MEKETKRKNVIQFVILGVVVAAALIAGVLAWKMQTAQSGRPGEKTTETEGTGSEPAATTEPESLTPEDLHEAAAGQIAAYAFLAGDTYRLDETAEDYLYFGQYPQTLVQEEAVIAYLDTVSFDENGFAAVDDATFAVIEKDGTKTYYAVEPIRWYILEEKEDSYYLFAEKVLDCQQYHTTYDAVNFNTADITKWLNGYFYQTAFTEAQQTKITMTPFLQAYNPIYGNLTGETAEFLVALMQMDDLMDGTYIFTDEDNQSKRAFATDYAAALGVHVDEEQYGRYWTCAQGYDAMNVVCADSSGILSYSGYFVYQTDIGVRPVITILK